jgi:hypothetical protein
MVFGDDGETEAYGSDLVPIEPPPTISPLFTHDDERAIVQAVFCGDANFYRQTIEQVLSSGSWEEAALIIDEYFTGNAVEPFSTEAVTFTNILQSAFIGQ